MSSTPKPAIFIPVICNFISGSYEIECGYINVPKGPQLTEGRINVHRTM